MSGFTRDPEQYGDLLVYEALESKWSRNHRHCECGQHWQSHISAAGFAIVRTEVGFVAITGPGLTEGVDEDALTINALWEAVTGTPGAQDWQESVRTIDRLTATGAAGPDSLPRTGASKRGRSGRSKKSALATQAQLACLMVLQAADPEGFALRLRAAFGARAVGGEVSDVIAGLPKLVAQKLISQIKGAL